eukprot:9489930-Pyramimonas_sp.AAC.1
MMIVNDNGSESDDDDDDGNNDDEDGEFLNCNRSAGEGRAVLASPPLRPKPSFEEVACCLARPRPGCARQPAARCSWRSTWARRGSDFALFDQFIFLAEPGKPGSRFDLPYLIDLSSDLVTNSISSFGFQAYISDYTADIRGDVQVGFSAAHTRPHSRFHRQGQLRSVRVSPPAAGLCLGEWAKEKRRLEASASP